MGIQIEKTGFRIKSGMTKRAKSFLRRCNNSLNAVINLDEKAASFYAILAAVEENVILNFFLCLINAKVAFAEDIRLEVE